MSDVVIFYHANCLDGFTAAWLLHHNFDGKAELIPVDSFDKKPREVWGKEVIVVDGSFRLGQMVDMARQCKKLTLIDHHEETVEVLRSAEFMYSIRGKDFRPLVDLTKCSSRIVNRRFPRELCAIDGLLNYVEDIDLKRYELPCSRAVEAHMMGAQQTVDGWNVLATHMAEDMERIVESGHAILYRQRADVISMVSQSVRWETIGGRQMPLANVPPTHTKAALEYMLKSWYPDRIVAVYFDSATRRNYTLASSDPIEIKHIVAHYGGKRNSFSVRAPK